MLAYSHRAGEWSERRVEKFHESIYEGPLFTLHTDGGEVRTTVYHPFWVTCGRDLDERSAPREIAEREDEDLSLAGRWVNSHELRCGDVLIGQDGQRRTVLKIEQEYVSGFLVHNLTIGEDHTFAVGADGVLVHNTGGCNAPNSKPIDSSRPRHGTLEHDATAFNEAKRLENSPGTVDARFNQDLVDSNGNRINGFRPDAQRRTVDGKVDVTEVRSPSQSEQFMDEKIRKMRDALGYEAGSIDWIDPSDGSRI